MRKKRLFKPVNFFIFVLFLITGVTHPLPAAESQTENTEPLREEILAVYQSKGEQGLRDFFKKQNEKITGEFIVDLAGEGAKKRNKEWLKVCEIIAEEKKDRKLQANIHHHTGRYFSALGDRKKAFDYLDKALSIYQTLNETIGLGKVYQGKGDIYFYTGETSNANGMYDKALPLFETAGHPLGMGNIYLRKGDIYLRVAENLKAIEMYDKALVFFKKARDSIGQGNVSHMKGVIFTNMLEHSRAIETFDEALSFFEKAGDDHGLGNVYLSKGDMYSSISENSRALEMYDKALPFFENAGATIGQGNIYQRKGIIYFNTGDSLRAIQMFDKALPFFEKVGDPLGQGNVYLRKGMVYLGVGEDSKALEIYDKALVFFEKVGTPFGLLNVYLRKGDIYSNLGKNSKAIQMYDKALYYSEKFGNPIGKGVVYHGKGRIYSNDGDNLKALDMFSKALPFFEKAGNPVGQGNVYRSKGDIYSKIGQKEKADKMFDKALTYYKKAGDIESESLALHGKAKALVKLGEKEKTRNLFEKGINGLEKVRTQTAFSEMKRTFMEIVYRQYEETVLFMLENKYDEKGFRYTESMRARVFLDRMVEGLVRPDKGLTSRLKEKRDDLVAKLSLVSKEMHETACEKEKKKLQELKDRYHKVEGELEDLLVEIRLNNPLYASVRYPRPITVRTLQKDVLKKGELLLRYFISPEKTYVFLVSGESFTVVSLNAEEKEIIRIVKAYLLALTEKNVAHIKRYGINLYRKLFKPLEPEIKKSTEIILVPDGQLATIPFESLIIDKNVSGRPVFLLEKYRIKYIQSASLLSILRKYYSGDSNTKNFIGFGDPVYKYEHFKKSKPVQAALTGSPQPKNEIKQVLRSRYARSGGTFDRLPASGEEVNAIARLFKKYGQKATVFSRAEANEENAKAPGMKDFDYIHFACHGLLNENFQSLVLSRLPGEQSTEDGYFTLNEIMNCDYRAKLIVLSACQTGSGKMERAEGVTGLTRAVMYAGTPAVVASLWNVDDQATKELMLRFYRNLLEKNMDKTEALRQAKLMLIKDKKYCSSYYWSAFVMYGE